MSKFIKKSLLSIVLFTALLALIVFLVKNNTQPKNQDIYILKSYKNSVALYKNDELFKIYDNIVLNTLPQKDIQLFNSGISVSTPTEAEILLEDYDG